MPLCGAISIAVRRGQRTGVKPLQSWGVLFATKKSFGATVHCLHMADLVHELTWGSGDACSIGLGRGRRRSGRHGRRRWRWCREVLRHCHLSPVGGAACNGVLYQDGGTACAVGAVGVAADDVQAERDGERRRGRLRRAAAGWEMGGQHEGLCRPGRERAAKTC